MAQMPGVPPDLIASLPASSRHMLYGAGFFMFSSVGFLADLMNERVATPTQVLVMATLTGVTAVLVMHLAAYYPKWALLPIAIPLVASIGFAGHDGLSLATAPVGSVQTKLLLDGVGCLVGFAASYSLFMWFIGREGARYARVHAEVQLAGEIHRLLVPVIDRSDARYAMYGVSRPATDVGGDLVDFVPADAGWIGYVADVSGHGVGSGLLMGIVKSAMRTRLLARGDLGDMLTDINAVVAPLSKPSMYATIAALRDDGSGALEVTTAGHLPVLHYRAAAQRMDRVSLPQIPIGMFDERTYTSSRIEVATGDLLAIVTDGLTEVFDAEDREFGLDRLADAIASRADQPLQQIAATVLGEVRGHGPQLDDQTLLLVRVL